MKNVVNTLAVATASIFFVAAPVAAESSGHGHHDGTAGHHMKTTDGMKVMMMLDPAMPKAKTKVAANLTFTEEKSGKAVAVSGVELKWSMPDHGHDVDTKKATPQRETGKFKSSIELPMDGKYKVEISAKKGEKVSKVAFEFSVGMGMEHDSSGNKMDHDSHGGDMSHGEHKHR